MSESGIIPEPIGIPTNLGPFDGVAIGASAGGPKALETVLSSLPGGFPLPVAVCQHMPRGWTEYLAERLDDVCTLKVKEAEDGEAFLPGCVYVASSGLHMRLEKNGEIPVVSLDPDFADSLHVPSIDIMMRSFADVLGHGTLAVLLSGMGSDGAQGMLAIRRAGGFTIAQSAESSAQDSMPSSAYGLGAAATRVHLHDLPRMIQELTKTGV